MVLSIGYGQQPVGADGVEAGGDVPFQYPLRLVLFESTMAPGPLRRHSDVPSKPVGVWVGGRVGDGVQGSRIRLHGPASSGYPKDAVPFAGMDIRSGRALYPCCCRWCMVIHGLLGPSMSRCSPGVFFPWFCHCLTARALPLNEWVSRCGLHLCHVPAFVVLTSACADAQSVDRFMGWSASPSRCGRQHQQSDPPSCASPLDRFVTCSSLHTAGKAARLRVG
jgi:hypothetical protein